VMVSAVTTGCKLSFHAAGTLLRPPSASASGDQVEQVSATTSSERPWLPFGRGMAEGGDVESHKSYKLTREVKSQKLPTMAEAREQARRQKDLEDDLREEAAWRATELVGKVRGRQRVTQEGQDKQNVLKARDVVARVRPAGKEWLSLPEVFVLANTPSASSSDPAPTIYTLKEKKGFYDLGQGYKSPAFKHHLPVFADKADAMRSALRLEALGFENITVQRMEARQTFVFSAKAGMHISFVPSDTLFLPPEEEAGNDDIISSIEQKWRSEGADIFDMNLLEDNLGIDYQDARQRLEQLLRNPDL